MVHAQLKRQSQDFGGQTRRGDIQAGGARSSPANNSLMQATLESRFLKESSARKLDARVSVMMGERLGADFSDVRVHTDEAARQVADGMSARAFTSGRDIYFNEGEYDPNSYSGQWLLAHELTHTIQQGHVLSRSVGNSVMQTKLRVGGSDTPAEAEADRVADQVMQGSMPSEGIAITQNVSQGTVQRGRKKELDALITDYDAYKKLSFIEKFLFRISHPFLWTQAQSEESKEETRKRRKIDDALMYMALTGSKEVKEDEEDEKDEKDEKDKKEKKPIADLMHDQRVSELQKINESRPGKKTLTPQVEEEINQMTITAYNRINLNLEVNQTKKEEMPSSESFGTRYKASAHGLVSGCDSNAKPSPQQPKPQDAAEEDLLGEKTQQFTEFVQQIAGYGNAMGDDMSTIAKTKGYQKLAKKAGVVSDTMGVAGNITAIGTGANNVNKKMGEADELANAGDQKSVNAKMLEMAGDVTEVMSNTSSGIKGFLDMINKSGAFGAFLGEMVPYLSILTGVYHTGAGLLELDKIQGIETRTGEALEEEKQKDNNKDMIGLLEKAQNQAKVNKILSGGKTLQGLWETAAAIVSATGVGLPIGLALTIAGSVTEWKTLEDARKAKNELMKAQVLKELGINENKIKNIMAEYKIDGTGLTVNQAKKLALYQSGSRSYKEAYLKLIKKQKEELEKQKKDGSDKISTLKGIMGIKNNNEKSDKLLNQYLGVDAEDAGNLDMAIDEARAKTMRRLFSGKAI